MKLLFGMMVFTASVTLGIFSVTVETAATLYSGAPVVDIPVPDPEARHRVEVVFAGIRSEARDIGTVYLIFFIHNRTGEPLTYTGHSRGKAFPVLRVRGELLPSAHFRSRRSERYTIPPGGVAKILVAREEFFTRPPAGTSISVGFRLQPDSAPRSTVHFSRQFSMPEGLW